MARTAEYDPIVVDHDVGTARLAQLLAMGRESAKLDYKASYQPGDPVGRVRLVKHVLAMANTAGGYIVLGVDDNGEKLGLSKGDLSLLDEAAIRQQVSGYTAAPISLFLANRLAHDDRMFALLAVLPLQDRIAVATADGQFPSAPGRSAFEFRKGDVLVRHGSASERWTQEDADWLLQRLLRISKDRWIADFSMDLFRLLRAAGLAPPAVPDAGAYHLPPDEFSKLVLDLLRRPNG